jgi:positive regulator of sigma E activity
MNKLLFWVLASASLMLLFPLIYSLVYAPHDSECWKNRLVIGICYMTVTRFAVMAYRRFHRAHS